MPDLDNDNPTPDFDALIAQARQLREAGKNDNAIGKYQEARSIDFTRPELCDLLELYVEKRSLAAVEHAYILSLGTAARYNQFGNLAEAVNTYHRICQALLESYRQHIGDETENPGRAFAILSIFAKNLGENDPHRTYQLSKQMADRCGWSDFHTKCELIYLSASEENLEETLTTLREWAQENPAAWFYVGSLERDEDRLDEAREAYGQVPENDPNYVRAMLLAGECWECDEIFYEAEEYYQKALDAAPRSREARLAYLYNHIKILLEEAAENGFERDRVDQASEFIGKIYRVLSGKPAEADQGRGTDERRTDVSAGPRLLAEQDMAFFAQIVQNLGIQIIGEVRTESRSTREEIRAGRQDIQNLQEQLEANIASSAEMIHKYVVERLQAYQEQIADCERRLNEDHREFWEQLTPESRCYLATGDYIREKSPAGMECSGETIEYAKALETELRQHLVGRFISFAQERGRGPNIFGQEPGRVTLGSFLNVLEKSGLKSEFVEHLGENGVFLSRSFHILKEIKKLRDAAAHGGNIGRQQATKLRDLVLKILPKIVALRSR